MFIPVDKPQYPRREIIWRQNEFDHVRLQAAMAETFNAWAGSCATSLPVSTEKNMLNMPDGLMSCLSIVLALLALGLVLAAVDRQSVNAKWLLFAAALVLVNDVALTAVYGFAPQFALHSPWNWQGKLLALGITLVIAARPAIGWRAIGLTWAQKREGARATYAVCAVLVLVFAAIGLASPNEPVSTDTLAFQLTMPGLEEELFYRGVLLLALNEAFRSRWRVAGIDVGWGGLVSCMLFGLAHGFSFEQAVPSFDAMSFLVTGLPALALVWVRERTGSLVLPILLHNFANLSPLLL
jgi:uncharacterized protein